MYHNLRKNFMPITAGICVIFAIATVQGAYEYKKAVNTKEALKFSQDYDSNVKATSKFNVASKYLANYDLVKLMNTDKSDDADYTSLNKKYWECALKKGDEAFEKVEQSCVEEIKKGESTVKKSGYTFTFNPSADIIKISKDDMNGVTLANGKVTYDNITIPYANYKNYLKPDGTIDEKFLQTAQDIYEKYKKEYISADKRNAEYEKNVTNNWNYSGYKKKVKK